MDILYIKTKYQNLKKYKFFLSLFLSIIVLCGLSESVFAANITLSPSSVSTKVGKTFSLDIMLSNNSDTINAVSAKLVFPSSDLEVVSLSKTGSFINLWAEEPIFSNKDGTISLEGVALNPGFNKSSGKVLTILFKTKQAGNVTVTVKDGQVLANDGNATDVLKTTGAAFIYINEEEDTSKIESPKEIITPLVTSPTHPDETKWYSRKDATFEWKVPVSVTSVRTLYSEKAEDKPTKVYDPPVTNRSFTVDNDGTYYMHVQFKNASGWGDVAHYKFQVDSKAPESLKVSFPEGVVTTNHTPNVLVVGEDSLSGITSITMSVDNGQPIVYSLDPSNLYRLPKQSSGNHTIAVSAIDNAGNSSLVSLDYTIQTITAPTITEYTKKVTYDTTFKVVGATYPQAIVEVVLTDIDGVSFTSKTTSNDGGVFSLLWGDKLPSGIYEMKARVSDGKGSVSEYTDNRVIIVETMMLIRIGIFVMNWLSAVLLIVISVLTISGTLWYAFVQFVRFRRKIKRNIAEVENTLRVNVGALRRDTEEFHDILVKAERKRELTKEEQAILKKFKKRLEITEKEIEKKLEEMID